MSYNYGFGQINKLMKDNLELWRVTEYEVDNINKTKLTKITDFKGIVAKMPENFLTNNGGVMQTTTRWKMYKTNNELEIFTGDIIKFNGKLYVISEPELRWNHEAYYMRTYNNKG